MLNTSLLDLFHRGHKVVVSESFRSVLTMGLECPLFKLTLSKAVIHMVATLIPLISMILPAPLAGALTLLQWVLAQRFEPGHLVQ
jgi:hypothetical protein